MKKLKSFAFLSMVILSSCSTILVNTTNRGGIQENPAQRTSGAIVEDRSIETKVAVNLKADSLAFRENHFNVVSHNGVVLLVGQIENETMKQKATEIASKASSKIKRIHNELEITQKRGILSRGNDTWIATKVRTLMFANEKIAANQVKVVVENGVVYLMGIVTETEGDTAANVARNVVGVTKVIKVFEYLT